MIPKDNTKPFLEHLSDLRVTLLECLAAWAAGMLIVFPLVPRIFGMLSCPLRAVTDSPERFLRSLEITGGFSIAMQILLWGGLLLGAPAITFFLAKFILPGLTMLERRVVLGSLGFVAFLFAAGVTIGYIVTLPVALKVMFGIHGWLGISAEWTAVSYISFALKLLLAFGLAFEIPVIIVGLGCFGIVSSLALRRVRRHAVVAILILAMLLTPPDVVTQMVMAVPMIFFYEACIWIVKLIVRGRGYPRPVSR